MQTYVLIPLTACVVSAMLAAATLARGGASRANQIAGLLVIGAAEWAFCEVLWNTADDPALVLHLTRLSALGWGVIGPLALHLFLEVAGERESHFWRALPWAYGLGGVAILVSVFTPLMHTGVTRESWGWSYQFGPAYPAFLLFTLGCVCTALVVGYRGLRSPDATESERAQMRLMGFGVMVPLFVASTTDGILPLLGYQVPRLGTAAFSVLAAVIVYAFHRYGYPLLAPGAFHREILAALRDGVCLLRPDGSVRNANLGMARLAGCEPSQLEGRPARDFLPDVPLDPSRELVDFETELRTGSGPPIPVSVSTALLHDKQGYTMGQVLAVHDLQEVVALRNHLVMAGRMAAVGELAAGIAHEINNPMAYVHSNLAQLRKHWQALGGRFDVEGDEATAAHFRDGLEMLDESLDGVDRTAAIVRDIKGFSHAGPSEPETLDLNELLDTVLRVAAPQLRYRAEVERAYGELPLVKGSPQHLKQVFLNLVLNAAHAIGEDGRIRVGTSRIHDDVWVTVADNGSGIEPAAQQRIFDPFFTTKDVGEGTGLGLAISYQIVCSHGGDVGVESRPGWGSVFRVRLPIHGPVCGADEEEA